MRLSAIPLISLKAHSFFDYAAIFGALGGAFIFGYADQFWPMVVTVTFFLGGVFANTTAKLPMSPLKWLPIEVHVAIDYTGVVGLIGLPLILFPQEVAARNVLMATGVFLLTYVLLTDFRQERTKS